MAMASANASNEIELRNMFVSPLKEPGALSPDPDCTAAPRASIQTLQRHDLMCSSPPAKKNGFNRTEKSAFPINRSAKRKGPAIARGALLCQVGLDAV
jgi:hypothetical protein